MLSLTVSPFKKPTSFAKPLALLKKGRLLILEKCGKKWCYINDSKNINKCIDVKFGEQGYWKECDMNENPTENIFTKKKYIDL